MKRWQKKKLRNELICLALLVFGAFLIKNHIFDICPWPAWVGFVAVICGLFSFIEVRNTKNSKYQKKYPEKTRK